MTAGGWIMMGISLFVVWAGAAWCYKTILSSPQDEKVPIGYGP